MRITIIIILSILLIIAWTGSCDSKVEATAPYMNDSTLTDVQKRALAIEDHIKNNPILFKKIYDNNTVPSIVDDFSKLDVIEMNYDSIVFLIIRSKNNYEQFEILNVTKDKAMIEYYKNHVNTYNNTKDIRNENSNSLFGTDITKGYFDRN